MKDYKKGLVVVRQTNYSNVVEKGVALMSALAKEHGYGPKMETQFLTDVAGGVELLSKEARQAYMRSRLKKSLARYIELNMHTLAGMSEEGFREALAPLVEKTIDFFSPPAKHPIIDGQFSCLLVIPTDWISLRSQLGLLHRAYGLRPDFPERFTGDLARELEGRVIASYGRVAPKEPYVIVGINGGRALKGSPRGNADATVGDLGLSYFLTHEYIQLLLVRPQFLVPEEGGIVLGEKFHSGYLRVIARGGYLHEGGIPKLDFAPETSNDVSFRGLGKPTYTKMIVL